MYATKYTENRDEYEGAKRFLYRIKIKREGMSREEAFQELLERFPNLTTGDPDFQDMTQNLKGSDLGIPDFSQEDRDIYRDIKDYMIFRNSKRGNPQEEHEKAFKELLERLEQEYPHLTTMAIMDPDFQDMTQNLKRSDQGIPDSQDQSSDRNIIEGLSSLDIMPSKIKEKTKKTTRVSLPQEPECLRTSDNFHLQGRFGRYNPLRNYDILNDDYEYIYGLLYDFLKPIESFPNALYIASLGVIRIKIVNGTITYKKVAWDDGRDAFIREHITSDQLDELQRNPRFRRFMDTLIIKAVQDRMIQQEFKFKPPKLHTFDVLLNLYNNRSLAQQDMYHQDHDKAIDSDYFTLTYITPPGKKILGASILIRDPSDPTKTTGSGVNIPVSNLCTLALSNYDLSVPPIQGANYPQNLYPQYHSTPAITTSREFIDASNQPRTLDTGVHPYRQARLDRFIGDFSNKQSYQLQTGIVDLEPYPLQPLNVRHLNTMTTILSDSLAIQRSFFRCWFCRFIDPPNNNLSSYEYTIDSVNLTTLLLETYTINRYTALADVIKHFIGGRKKYKKNNLKEINLSKAIKLMENPENNIMVSYGSCRNVRTKKTKRKRTLKTKKHFLF